MNRHPVRWTNLVSGLFFLSTVALWAGWSQDVLTPRELSLTASAVLIVLGLIGVAATLWHARPTPPRPTSPRSTTIPEGDTHEEAHPQS